MQQAASFDGAEDTESFPIPIIIATVPPRAGDHASLVPSSVLFSFSDRKIDQKKNTTFRNSTLSMGGQNAMFTAVAGTHSFQFASIVST
mmetsp:Transcript_50805/g.108265  ORF Transcript_50805/g.108265 Transcript_50805/m.108265 type:complete len:89 (-) Transcript_50805:843-1109(-)